MNKFNNTDNYATLNRRLIALSIDMALLIVILTPIFSLIMYLAALYFSIDIVSLINMIITLFSLVIAIFYFTWCWIRYGASLGERVMSCKIVDEKTF